MHFNSLQEFLDFKFIDKINFSVYYDKTMIGFFYGNIKYNLFHNLNGPAQIDLQTGELHYFIFSEYIGKDLSNEEFKNKVKEYIFK